ncbi:MAG: hypothetical protein COV67_06290 [Nitrospinae bacterium CG11_big_fil_rev_8_21_14_0_20_56_8]|nr:MAG: hypothetical protein COV67_06290 [Nitrospinae bacterium CG11_big_fil_rev_8_21_14_0_20_56_8]
MNFQKVLEQVLSAVPKIASDTENVISIFFSSGIKINPNLQFESFEKDPAECIQSLIVNLSSHPALKIYAREKFKELGI